MATIHHAWQPPAEGNPDSYNLYEGPGVGQETLFISLPGTQTTYDRLNADLGTYSGYVRAVYGGVEGTQSNGAIVTVTLPPPPPSPILGGYAQIVAGQSQIKLYGL